MRSTHELQQNLKLLGYDPGPLDGALGPITRRAIREFQADNGLMVDGIAGPRTWAAIDRANGRAGRPTEASSSAPTPPWVDEMMRRKGLHERRNHAALLAWLKSAGGAVDPKRAPWCGDAVETAILRALPNEPMPSNPMASINWLKFGRHLETPALGAVLVFWRGSPKGWQGHVGFYAGEDATHYHVLGGNQTDAITKTRIAKNRLRPGGVRWPETYPLPQSGRIVSDGRNLVETTNEA